MSENPKNIQEYLATKVINYLKDRDEKILLYEKMLKYVRLDECNVCKRFIGVNCIEEGEYSRQRFPSGFVAYNRDVFKEDKYRRCYNAINSDYNCNTIVCGTCEDNCKYPWHKGKFGIPPRRMTDDDYICMTCSGIEQSDQKSHLDLAIAEYNKQQDDKSLIISFKK